MENNRNPLVSVYVISYNHEKYISKCLDSILAQKTDFPFEAIVIDDASTDSTQDIIREYAAKYPDVIIPVLHKENQVSRGHSHFFESFLPRARGEFKAICEGDDYWCYPYKLQRQADFLRTHPKYSCCFHIYDRVNESDLPLPPMQRPFRRARARGPLDILMEPKVQFACMMSRLDYYRETPEAHAMRDEMWKNGAYTDSFTFGLALAHGKAYIFPHVWSMYRVHTTSMTFSFRKNEDWFGLQMRAFKTLEKFWPKRFRGLSSDYAKIYKIRGELTAWTNARRKGQYAKAIGHMLKAFAISPRQLLRIYACYYI